MIKSSRIFFVNHIMSMLPSTRMQRVKKMLYTWAGVEIGKNVELFQGIKVYGNGRLIIGDGSFIGHNVTIMVEGNGKVEIQESVVISSNVVISTGFHDITPYGERVISRSGTTSNIVIKRGAAVLLGGIVLPNVEIGENAIVAAGAVVNCKVEERTMVGGVPARLLKCLS